MQYDQSPSLTRIREVRIRLGQLSGRSVDRIKRANPMTDTVAGSVFDDMTNSKISAALKKRATRYFGAMSLDRWYKNIPAQTSTNARIVPGIPEKFKFPCTVSRLLSTNKQRKNTTAQEVYFFTPTFFGSLDDRRISTGTTR